VILKIKVSNLKIYSTSANVAQWRQSGLKSGGCRGSGFEERGVAGSKSSTDVGTLHMIEVIIPGIFI